MYQKRSSLNKKKMNFIDFNQELSQSDALFFYLINRRYGLPPEIIPGKTLEQKYQFISEFDWNKIPGDSHRRKLQYVTSALQEAIEADIRMEKGLRYSETFDIIVKRVIKVGDPNLVRMILNELIKRIPEKDLPDYDFNLVISFIEALREGRPEVIQVLLPYYRSTERIRQRNEYDPKSLLLLVLKNAIKNGETELVERIRRYTEIEMRSRL